MNKFAIYFVILALFLVAPSFLWGAVVATGPEPASGWRAFREKRYDDALKDAQRLLGSKPKDVGANWLAAQVTLIQKDTTSSIRYWRNVLESDPIHPQAMMNLVDILFARADTVGVQKILEAAQQKKPDLYSQKKKDLAASSYSTLASSARSTESKIKPDVAAFAYCNGRYLDAKGQVADAMVELSRAIENDPNHSRFYVALARIYIEKNVLPLAKDNYLSALNIDSTIASTHYGLATVQMDMREYSEALAQFKKARDLDPDYPNVDYQIGKLYFYGGKYEQASQELQLALQKSKADNFFLFSLYGQTLRVLRKLDDAQQYLEKAYSLKPGDLANARALAANSFDTKNYSRAVEVLRLITTPPQAEPTDYSLLGESYYNMAVGTGNKTLLDSAAVYTKKGYELNPTNSRLAYLLGMTYFSSDQYDSALVYFGKKVQDDPKSSVSYFYLGYCYLKKEMYQDAAANLRHATEVDPTKAPFHTMLAQTLIFIDSTKAAKQEFMSAVQLDSTQSDAYGGLGFILLREESWSAAAANLKRAVELQPANPAYWIAYGQASYYKEDYSTAEQAFRRALQLDPSNKDAKTGLETISKIRARKKQLQ